MSKRRSTEGGLCDMLFPSKRLAIDACTTASGLDNTYISGSQTSQPDAHLGQASTSTFAHDGTLEVWLAVAAQVQDALAALPGWIQVTQAGVQLDQPEHLSSRSSASTPMPVQHYGNTDCGSWPIHPSAAQLDTFNFANAAFQLAGMSPAAPAPAGTPASAVAVPSAAGDLPAQPAAAAALNSCASESDAAAAACGWFSKCRGCCQLTAGEVELQEQVVPLCRGCSSALHRKPLAEHEHVVHRIMRAHAALCRRETAGSGSS